MPVGVEGWDNSKWEGRLVEKDTRDPLEVGQRGSGGRCSVQNWA